MDVVLAHPPGWDLMPEVRERAEAAAEDGGGSITYTNDMDEAFTGADVVYPKSWGRLDAFSDAVGGRGDPLPATGSATRAGCPWRRRTRCTCTACPPTAATR